MGLQGMSFRDIGVHEVTFSCVSHAQLLHDMPRWFILIGGQCYDFRPVEFFKCVESSDSCYLGGLAMPPVVFS